jgi:hypothetical protein
MEEEQDAGGEGEHKRGVLHEDDRPDAAARGELSGLPAAACREEQALSEKDGRQPADEAGDVDGLEERVGQAAQVLSSTSST